MKKFILILICIIFFNLVAMADNSTLTTIENSIFGTEYKKETDIQRVERIESYLYGNKKSGNLQERIKIIKDDIGYSEPVVPKKKPSPQPVPSNIKNNVNPAATNEIPNIKEDATVDYPIVDRMEMEIFKTTYKNDNIYKRLDRLEEKVFNKKSQASLNDRVDKLADVISPAKLARMPEQTSYNDPYSGYFQNTNMGQVTDQSMAFQLAALEQELLKGNYTNDNTAVRLNRLENKLFNRTFPSDSDVDRMQRLLVAYNAQRSSYKYENNRKMQNMATMSQLGGILLMLLAILL